MPVLTTYVSLLIQERRQELGLRQSDLAERIGVARNTVNRWERGSNQPTAPMRQKLAEELGGDPDDYEWSEADFERQDRLTQVKLEINAMIRRLIRDIDHPN